MVRSSSAMLSGPDMKGLMSALLDAQGYTAAPPTRMTHNLTDVPVPSDWRERLLALDEIDLEWGPAQRISGGRNTIAVGVPPDPPAVLALLARLPFEIATISSLHDHWIENDYFAPETTRGALGWGFALKGAGHERWVVSRRWLEHGPFRTLQGAGDTTLVQFHDLAADGPTSLEQARAGHEWIEAGLLFPDHKYKHDIAGIYTKEDGLLRIVVNDRKVTDAELLDACFARRDGRDDAAKPIKNIAYIFVDEKAARAHLPALWLRGLECRVADGGGERRLDTDYTPSIARPAWVGAS